MSSSMLLSADGASDPGATRDVWPPELMGGSVPSRRARDLARQAALPDARALIVAERGLDAPAIARAIHRLGSPPDAPLVTVDCGGAARGIEETLFGSPTAGRSRRSEGSAEVPGGRLLAARGGTLFLAHVTDLPAAAQARLARTVRDGEYRAAGHGRVQPLALRILAGAGPAIDADVEDGAFRVDLFRRLSALRIDVPPLRLRPEDIGAIARHLAESAGGAANRAALRFTGAALGFLSALPWEGNLGELAEVVEALGRRAPSSAVRVEDVLGQIRLDRPLVPARYGSLRDARRQFEREYIAAVLRQHGWRMSDAAKALGMQRTNLYRKARQLKVPGIKVTG